MTRSRGMPRRAHDFLDAIDEETDRLTLMVSNLLDLSRIEGGALRPQKDWYDVDELIGDVAGRMAGRAADIRSPSDHRRAGSAAARFDYVEIAQVLINLIENAVKYTPPGTPITSAVGSCRARSRSPCMTMAPAFRESISCACSTSSTALDPRHRVAGSGIGSGDQQGTGRGARRADLGRERAGERNDVSLHPSAPRPKCRHRR